LEAGTYYIEIAKYQSYTGVYTLNTDFISFGNNEIEPNNTRDTAQTILSGQTVKGFISYQDNNDFYKIVLTQTGRLTVGVTREGNMGLSSFTIRWIDSNGVQIRSTTHTSSSNYNAYMDLGAGTYYIEIAKYNGNTGVYNLNVSIS